MWLNWEILACCLSWGWLGFKSSEDLLGTRESTQSNSLTWLTGWCWFLVEDLSSSSSGPLHRAVWVSLWIENWLLPEQTFQRPRCKPQHLFWPSFRSHTPSLPPDSMGYTEPSLIQSGRGVHKQSLGPSWRLTTTLLDLLQVLKL